MFKDLEDFLEKMSRPDDVEKLLTKGTVVKHFKREMMTTEELQEEPFKYLYLVNGLCTHTETGEALVVYTSFSDHKLWARPVDVFISKVDKEKYPDAKQEYRFEIDNDFTIRAEKLRSGYDELLQK